MKKGLAITLIICAILFIVGGVLIVLGIANGGAMFFNIDYAHHKVNTSSSKEIISGNEDVDPFTDIEIDVDAAAVTIVKGESYHVDYKLSADAYDKVDIGVESGKLKINAKHKSNYLSLSVSPLPDDLKPYIEITVPENAELKDGTITVDAGNIGVKDLSFDNFTVDSDAGKVTLENATIGSSSLDTDAGDIDITGSDLEKLTIDTDAGNIDIDESKVDKLEVNTDFGDVDVKLIGEEADYAFDIKVDAGDISVCGKNMGNKYNANEDKDKKIVMNVDAGNVDIEF